MSSSVSHTFQPIFNKESKVLILGTMPSPKSRENGFYYSHPQNRFWRIMADLLSQPLPKTVAEKKEFLSVNHIAMWDVLASCQINGADDSSIKNPIANDMGVIFNTANIKAIFTTGKKATQLYEKHCLPKTKIPSQYLPSTSPANCRYAYEEILGQYQTILKHLDA